MYFIYIILFYHHLQLIPFNEETLDLLLELWIKYKNIAIILSGEGQKLDRRNNEEEDWNEEDEEDLPDFINISDTLFDLILYFIQNNSSQQKELSIYLGKLKNSSLKKEILNKLNTLHAGTIERYSTSSELLKQGLISSK